MASSLTPRARRLLVAAVLIGFPTGCLETNPRYDGAGTASGGGSGGSGLGSGSSGKGSGGNSGKGSGGNSGQGTGGNSGQGSAGNTGAGGTTGPTPTTGATGGGTGGATTGGGGTGFTCPPPESLCVVGMAAFCFNLDTDKDHCGKCDKQCDNDEICLSGECKTM